MVQRTCAYVSIRAVRGTYCNLEINGPSCTRCVNSDYGFDYANYVKQPLCHPTHICVTYCRQQRGRRLPRQLSGQKNSERREGEVEEHWVVSQPGCPHYRTGDQHCETGYIHMVELRCNAHRSTDGRTLDRRRASYTDNAVTLTKRNSFVTFKPDNQSIDTNDGQAASVAGRETVFNQTMLSSPDVLESVHSISVHG